MLLKDCSSICYLPRSDFLFFSSFFSHASLFSAIFPFPFPSSPAFLSLSLSLSLTLLSSSSLPNLPYYCIDRPEVVFFLLCVSNSFNFPCADYISMAQQASAPASSNKFSTGAVVGFAVGFFILGVVLAVAVAVLVRSRLRRVDYTPK